MYLRRDRRFTRQCVLPLAFGAEIDIAGHGSALRLSYAGELRWELHGPAGPCPLSMMRCGRQGPTGIANYGSFAMNVMQMEKGFKGAGELTVEVTLPEAGVMRFVNLEKGDFRP